MSKAKRKSTPEQPELLNEAGTPVNAKPAKTKAAANGNANANGDGKSNGDGDSHVLAEEVPTVAHRPFSPGKIEQQLHRRVNTSFLEYASASSATARFHIWLMASSPCSGASCGCCTRWMTGGS